MAAIGYPPIKTILSRLAARLPASVAWPSLTLLLGIVLVALTLAQLTWRLLPGQPSASSAAPLTAPPFAGVKAASAVPQLADMQLFGQPQALPGNAINAPETTLDLTLRGIIAVDKQRVLAIIAQGGNEQPYKAGDTLPNGVILKEILATRVILERNGRFETLSLPKESLEQGDISPARMVGRAPGVVPSVAPLGQLRDQLRARPAELLGLNAVQPVMENGQLKGYQLTDNPYMSTLTAAGLRAGDMVTRVNGIPVTDQARIPEMMNQLSAASQLTLELERGGAPMSLTVDLGR